MRRHSIEAVNAFPVIPAGKISYHNYIDEMRRARLCFSLFGYGEICWRDIKAL